MQCQPALSYTWGDKSHTRKFSHPFQKGEFPSLIIQDCFNKKHTQGPGQLSKETRERVAVTFQSLLHQIKNG